MPVNVADRGPALHIAATGNAPFTGKVCGPEKVAHVVKFDTNSLIHLQNKHLAHGTWIAFAFLPSPYVTWRTT